MFLKISSFKSAFLANCIDLKYNPQNFANNRRVRISFGNILVIFWYGI